MMWSRFYTPALFYFILVTLTGSLLRLQWTLPEYALFNAKYLIHAHSHTALLGWVFLVICGLLLDHGMERRSLKQSRLTSFSLLVQIIVIGMLIAFTLQGYAPASIALSSAHIFLSYYFVVLYFRHERIDLNFIVRNFYNSAVFWLLFSSFGTLMLAAGSRLSPFWMDAAINFYLHLQFNGWFMFFLTGFAYQFIINRHYRGNPPWGNLPFALMFIGLVPSLIPILGSSDISPWLIYAGSAGTAAYSAGSAMVLWLIWKSRSAIRPHFTNILFWFAFVAATAKTAMQAVLTLPQAAGLFSDSHYVVIGFIHLLLLGFISTALLYILSRKAKAVLMSKIWVTGSVTYQIGACSMVLLLFGIGLMQILDIYFYFHIQFWLLITGLLTFSGLTLIAASMHNSLKSRTSFKKIRKN